MKVLPYETFEVHTSRNLEEIIAALQKEVEPKKWPRLFQGNYAFFEGDVSRQGFKLKRILNREDPPPYTPVIRGNFKQSPIGTTVSIKMSFRPFDIAFVCAWFGLFLGVFYAINCPLFFITIMLLFLSVMVLGSFWYEVQKTRAKLISILKRQSKSEQQAPLDQ